MNSDLNVLLYLFIDNTLQKVAISIKDGLNKFPDYEFWGEPDIQAKWKELLPTQYQDAVICDLEIIADIVYNNINKQNKAEQDG